MVTGYVAPNPLATGIFPGQLALGRFAPRFWGRLAQIAGRLASISGQLATNDLSTFYLRNKWTKLVLLYYSMYYSMDGTFKIVRKPFSQPSSRKRTSWSRCHWCLYWWQDVPLLIKCLTNIYVNTDSWVAYFLTASVDDPCLQWCYCIILWTVFPVVYNTYWYNANPCFHDNIP